MLTRRSFNRLAGRSAVAPLLHRWSQLVPLPAQALPLRPAGINYLMADEAERPFESVLKAEGGVPGPKRFWIENWRDPHRQFAWTIESESAGDWVPTLMVSAAPGTSLILEGPRNRVEVQAGAVGWEGHFWDRIALDEAIEFPKGRSRITLRYSESAPTSPHGVAVKSVELLNAHAVKPMQDRVRAFKSDPSWLANAKFGFMSQCGEWSYPPAGPHKPWPRFAEKFDVNKFVSMVESTGAGYAVWSATWATYYFPAPIRAIDEIMPGRTSQRDLVGEIADALLKKNIRLILYYHLGHEVNAQNGSWWLRNWKSPLDKTLFIKNWCSIIREVGERYRDRLAGWMFDDDLVYFPAPYEELGAAAKAGHKERLISYNPWIQARGTDFQDFQFGEGYRGAPEPQADAHGIWPAGPQKGLQAHGNFQVDGPDWGINHPNESISGPLLNLEQAADLALKAADNDVALSWNLNLYDDGSASPCSLELLQAVGKRVRQ